MKTLIEKADTFAERAHAGQVRKYTGIPYITHPRAVAALVQTVPHDDEMIAAALLHDVVEDCGVDFETIRIHFNSRVADIVRDLTEVSKPSDGNRAHR